MAFLSGYTKRWEYKVLASKVPSTQTNFPVYVDLSAMPASFWSTVADGGGDIRVTRSDGTTECAREVVSCATATDTGELHFLANSVDGTTDTVFYIYANGTSADYAVTDTYGRNAVWGDYEFVLHNGADNDSTGNYTPTLQGGMVAGDSIGKIGDATNYDGTDDGSDVTTSGVDMTTPFAMTVWVNHDTFPAGAPAVMSVADDTDTDFLGFWQNTSSLKIGTNGETPGNGSFSASAGTWYLLSILYDGTDIIAYGSGSFIYSVTPTSNNWQSGVKATIGFKTGDYIDAQTEEARFRNSNPGSNWITTEYNNQNDHSTWATIGAEETDGGGGGGATFNNFKGFGGL